MRIDLSKTLSRSLILGGALVAAPALAVPTVPPVPEPGTWAMMIFGFGLAGTMMRVRSLRARKATEVVKAD